MDALKIVVWATAGLAVVPCGTASAEPRNFRCQHQTLPEFTLREKSNPTDEQVEKLCQCIRDKLGTWEKTVATSLSKGQSPTEPRQAPTKTKFARSYPASAKHSRTAAGMTYEGSFQPARSGGGLPEYQALQNPPVGVNSVNGPS